MDWVSQFLQAIIGGTAGSGVGGGIIILFIRHWLKSMEQKNKKLEEQNKALSGIIENLKNDDMAKLKKDLNEHVKNDKTPALVSDQKHIVETLTKLERCLDNHIDNDKSPRILTLLETQGGTLDNLDAKFDRQTEITAKQEARLGGLDLYVANLDKSLQNHLNIHHTNSGRSK